LLEVEVEPTDSGMFEKWSMNGRNVFSASGHFSLSAGESGSLVASWGDTVMTTNEQSVAITTRRPNIVIVDDDDQIRHLLCAILDASGYKVRPASDGVVALEELLVEVPDILLSDLYMPRMSGFELLPFVRQQFPRTRVVAMSGEYSGYDVPAGIVADAFYAKASNIRDLLKIVETLVYLDVQRARNLDI
jgi:CheY-like chemotaxis protein